jgi:hypothetical protein
MRENIENYRVANVTKVSIWAMGTGLLGGGGRGGVYYNVYKTPCDGPLILSTLKRKEGKMAKAKAR